MDYSTSLETVYQAVYSLNNNPNLSEKEKASCYLNDFQNSIHAWKMADDMLHQKRDLLSCYFAAQTLRKKIQLSFHELPLDSHASLRDSLLSHVFQIDQNTNSIVVMQLCLALADLILQMPSWLNPIPDLMLKFGSSESHFWLLVEILTVLPEEVDSRVLRLGLDRKDQITDHFRLHAESILQGLLGCLAKDNDMQMAVRVFRCLISWILVDVISLTTPVFRKVIDSAFQLLESKMCESLLHEVTSDFVSATLQVLEKVKLPNRGESMSELQQFQLHLFDRVVNLRQSYRDSVATGNVDKSTNYCRIFIDLAEAFSKTIVHRSIKDKPHFTIVALDLVLDCVEHHDHEVAQVTFGFWYRFSEILFRRNDHDVNAIFENHIGKLINSLCRLCQLKPDHQGFIDEGCDFADFRSRALELIKDVVFVIGSKRLFTEMVSKLSTTSWQSIESALFVMTAVAKIIPPEDDKIMPSVVEGILNLPETTHVAVRHTSVLLLGELSEWMDQHPQALGPTLNFLFICLNHNGLGSAACIAFENICAECPKHMMSNFQGLLHIVRSLDNFAVDGRAANDLLGGVAKVLSGLPKDQVESFVTELCWLQARHLCSSIEQNVSVEKGSLTDPVTWLDRLSVIFRNVKIQVPRDTPHPCVRVANEIWPILSAVFLNYQADSRIMERCCRTSRFIVRCLEKHSEHLLQSLADLIVQLYATHKHSCFLYLGSILVDVFSMDTRYISGLLAMLEAFVNPTFVLLQETDGLQNHPTVVDDFFRLCWRFLQAAPVPFLQTSMIGNIVDCALVACSLDHRDANISVMKFLIELIHSGRSGQSKSDFTLRRQIIQDILCKKGLVLVWRLIHAVAFSLSSSALPDVADVLIELVLIDEDLTSEWLERALSEMKSEGLKAERFLNFHRDVMKAETTKKVADALRQFSRLFYSKSIVKGVKK